MFVIGALATITACIGWLEFLVMALTRLVYRIIMLHDAVCQLIKAFGRGRKKKQTKKPR
ncbi:hypothetical protein [Lacticaseibacillus hegangensis]|uniref:Uncharacterized protein n=1 Tax=Lacticaseibacillus hegangensis TaxID=2486010 RepID=A0ABW4CTN1_9LACO|nr:hypothetical protein [Lacticaseibacillus hegangensis]